MSFHQTTLNLLRKYKSELDEGFLQNAWNGHKGMIEYGQFESYLSYCFVREYRPTRVVEIGSGSGFSSYPLVLGIYRNRHGQLYSYETNEGRRGDYIENMERLGLYWDYCSIWGDARDILMEQLRAYNNYSPIGEDLYIHKIPLNVKSTLPIDILFMDADHGRMFAKWYLKELVPRTSKLLHVHDIYYGEPQMGEAEEVLAWIEQNPQYEWIKTMDLARDFGMDKVLDNDPVGSRNSGIWVRLHE